MKNLTTVEIFAELVDSKRWINGELVTIGKVLQPLGAIDNRGTRHSDQYRSKTENRLLNFEEYVEMMKNRFKYDEITIVEKAVNSETKKREEIKRYILN